MSWLLNFESGKRVMAESFSFRYTKDKIRFDIVYWTSTGSLLSDGFDVTLEQEKEFRKALAEGYIELHDTKSS